MAILEIEVFLPRFDDSKIFDAFRGIEFMDNNVDGKNPSDSKNEHVAFALRGTTSRILRDKVLRVDQSQSPVFVFEFSANRCRIIEYFVARSNLSEVFQRRVFAGSLANQVPKTTIGGLWP